MAGGGRIVERVVVGTDGSEHATSALRWAFDEAAIHGAALQVMLVWNYLDQHHADRADRFDPGYTEEAAQAALAAWVGEVLGAGAAVEQRVVGDVPHRALLDAGEAADLLVLGARGTGGFEGLLLGSVSARVAQHASCPVAVIRTAAPVAGARVVVGVDGSARSLDALRWAAAEARARDADLDVVHAWRLQPIMAPPPGAPVLQDLSAMEDAGRAILENALAEQALEGMRIRPHLTSHNAAQALIDVAAGAGLLVVGTRGLGRVTGALLGSVSRKMLHHAPCPVVVV